MFPSLSTCVKLSHFGEAIITNKMTTVPAIHNSDIEVNLTEWLIVEPSIVKFIQA